jgi:hypothetical protein
MAKTPPTMTAMQKAGTAARKAAFLEQFQAAGTVSAACRAAGIGRKTHYVWLKRDRRYAEAFKEAREVRVEWLETEARRRALAGWEEPVYQRGKLVGHIRKFSDTLLIFLLKAERPEKYRERFETRFESGQTPVTFTLNLGKPAHLNLPEMTEPAPFTIDLGNSGNRNGDGAQPGAKIDVRSTQSYLPDRESP